MQQCKQNFNGGPCITEKLRFWLLNKHQAQLYKSLQAIVHQK